MGKPLNFESRIENKSDNFTVVFEHAGEGYDGDYDPHDSKDSPLYRCDIFHNKDLFEPIRNGSFCTNVTLHAEEAKVNLLIVKMLKEAEELLSQFGPDNLGTISGRLAKYSWTTDKDLK